MEVPFELQVAEYLQSLGWDSDGRYHAGATRFDLIRPRGFLNQQDAGSVVRDGQTLTVRVNGRENEADCQEVANLPAARFGGSVGLVLTAI